MNAGDNVLLCSGVEKCIVALMCGVVLTCGVVF